MDSSLSAVAPHASEMYLVVAVALPPMLLVLISLRVLGARARWTGWDWPEDGGWAWRMPYEVFVLAWPFAAAVAGEWLAVVALRSGSNRSVGANRLIIAATAGLLVMGILAARSLPDRSSDVAPQPRRHRRQLSVDDGGASTYS